MYVRPVFEERDEGRIRSLVATHPFGLLVTHGPRGLEASHIPFQLMGETGLVLAGHLAAGNPQCDAIGGEAMAVFSGPHAYVSPGWYAAHPAVPTWDYAAVHLTGRLVPMEGATELGQAMDAMAAMDPNGFRVGQLEDGYRARMYAGVRAFTLVPTKVEAQWKMSQNRSAEDRRRVVAALRAEGEVGTATLIEETLVASGG